MSRRLSLGFTAATLLSIAPGAASADVDSLFTLGVGAQYAYVPTGAAAEDGAPTRQLGFVGRAKLLKFLGVEASTQFDQDPGTQNERLLSPRYQVGAMLNLVPTEYFNLFAVGGTGAHSPGALFDSQAEDMSFHFGPGLEVFVGDHVALGVDARFRMSGPAAIRKEVESIQQALRAEPLSTEPQPPIEVEVGAKVWQANFMVAVYL
jgi:hypothetical protein